MSEKKQMCYCANCGKEVTCVSKAEEITADRIIGRKKYLIPLTAAVCTECGEIAKCPDLIGLGMKETETYLGSIDKEDRWEYAKLVTTYFTPYEYLRKWWTEDCQFQHNPISWRFLPGNVPVHFYADKAGK